MRLSSTAPLFRRVMKYASLTVLKRAYTPTNELPLNWEASTFASTTWSVQFEPSSIARLFWTTADWTNVLLLTAQLPAVPGIAVVQPSELPSENVSNFESAGSVGTATLRPSTMAAQRCSS